MSLYRVVVKSRIIKLTNNVDKYFYKNSRYIGSTSQTSTSETICPAHVTHTKAEDSWSARCHVDKKTWDNAKPFSEMPGLKHIPIIGNTWRFLPGGEYHNLQVSEFMDKFHSKFGRIGRLEGILGLDNRIFLDSADDVELVYKQESIMPEREIFRSMSYFRANFRQEIFKDAKGLVTSNGQEWYTFRNKVNKIMMQPKVVKQYVAPIDTIAKEFIQRIRKIKQADGSVGDIITKEINKWALESIALPALDRRLGCLDDNLPVDSVPYKMISTTEQIFHVGEKLDFRPSLWRYISTPMYRKAMKIYNDQINLTTVEINKAMEIIKGNKAAGQVKDESEKSVLEKLLEIDPKVAVVMVSDMLLAGIDTTSSAFINALYYLSANEAKQQRLRDEINSVIPSNVSEITSDHLSEMPYLKACIKEAGRLYPVTPGTMRHLTKDTVLFGYQVPKGTKILLTHMTLSVKEEHFPRPTEFIPERWLRENQDSELSYKKAHPFATMQFGFGARACIGKRFAELELEVLLTNFIRSFNVSWRGEPPKKVTTSLNYLRGPFNFVFKDIKN